MRTGAHPMATCPELILVSTGPDDQFNVVWDNVSSVPRFWGASEVITGDQILVLVANGIRVFTDFTQEAAFGDELRVSEGRSVDAAVCEVGSGDRVLRSVREDRDSIEFEYDQGVQRLAITARSTGVDPERIEITMASSREDGVGGGNHHYVFFCLTPQQACETATFLFHAGRSGKCRSRCDIGEAAVEVLADEIEQTLELAFIFPASLFLSGEWCLRLIPEDMRQIAEDLQVAGWRTQQPAAR
ncbi:hypothetical protein [Hyphomicrobium sp. CS1BSMeth3]|uniref:hypothetical protein n=1 Tax=Hyphomicrobium sp. CS1BSMeth3 TaxID=1892844 RepID=UPI001160B6DE|nr:hypothetical protein [Hyphomicrobium sp. CS1BSMeth3]